MKVLRRLFSKYCWITLVIVIAVFFFVTCHIVFKPILRIDSDIIVSKKAILMDDARIYYSIVSSIYTIMFGFIGLLLGFLYFHGRKRFDAQNRKLDQLRNVLDRIIEKMDFVNQRTLDLILNYPDSNSLKRNCIANITSSMQEVNLLLEHNCLVIGLSDEDLNTIAKVHSMIEKKILLTELSNESEKSIRSLEQKYSHLMRQARMTLYQRYR